MTNPEDFKFPPYGYINLDFMKDWGQPASEFMLGEWDQSKRTAAWERLAEEIADDLAEWLWPRWKNDHWEGNARQHMYLLTLADLRLQHLARAMFNQPATVFRTVRNEPLERVCIGLLHSELFAEEDAGYLGTKYQLYDPVVAALRPDLVNDFIRAVDSVGGALDIELKQRMQRPRSYQVAFLLGEVAPPFSYQHATRADTPSLVSGHAFDGCSAGMGLYQLLLSLSVELSVSSEWALRQYTVDVGDRRVLAGLHYPTDNVASWYTALCLLDQIEPRLPKKLHHFLASAIRDCSMIYGLLKRGSADNEQIKRVMERLDRKLDESLEPETT